MLKLGVNIDHIATLRQARYRGEKCGEPDPIEAALICQEAGCFGITAHLREDRRHIQDDDIWRLKKSLDIPLNFEMANTPEMIGIAERLLPASVCLVPEKREELTTEGGLDVASSVKSIRETAQHLQSLGIEVSLFIDAVPEQIDASAQTNAKTIELHTGLFAKHFHSEKRAIERQCLCEAAIRGNDLGMKINAGHGLNYENIFEMHRIPHLCELNIGHSIISRAMQIGIKKAVIEMITLLNPNLSNEKLKIENEDAF